MRIGMPRKEGELEEGSTYNLLRNSILFQVNKSYVQPPLSPYSLLQSSFLLLLVYSIVMHSEVCIPTFHHS